MSALVPLANNRIRNGNFAEKELHWNASAVPPGEVDFSNQSCILRTNGRAEQTLTILGATAYTFSLYSLITYDGAGAASVTFEPSGTQESIPVSGNHGWLRRSLMFTTPADTTGATVQLTGTSGDVWFDNVRLVEDDGTIIPIELIRNGDFSANGNDWDVTASPPATATFNSQQSQLNHGGVIEQHITVTPGQTYTFSIDAQTPSGGHGFVRFHLAPDNVPEVELRGSGGWDTYLFSLTVPVGTPDFTLQVEGTTFLVVDNMSLQLAV